MVELTQEPQQIANVGNKSESPQPEIRNFRVLSAHIK